MKISSIGRTLILSASFLLLLLGCTEPGFEFATVPGLQGDHSGDPGSETFIQGTYFQKMDLLIIDDNSGSMAEEQSKLADRLASFLGHFVDIDWRLGITTTDVSDGTFGLKGRLIPWISTTSIVLSKDVPDYQTPFRNTVVRPESISCTPPACPSGDEQALRAMMYALEKRDTENAGFFRQDADLGILVLSDEDEMSTGTNPAAIQPQALVDFFKNLYGDEKDFFVYGMIIQPGDTTCLNTGGHYGTYVAELSRLTGGLIGSICDTDYGTPLGRISEHARALLNYVTLKYRPEGGTITVEFTPAHTTTLRVSGKRIYFTTPPPDGTQIKIDYIIL